MKTASVTKQKIVPQQGSICLEEELRLNQFLLGLGTHTHVTMQYVYGLAGKVPYAGPWITGRDIMLKSNHTFIGSSSFMNVAKGSDTEKIGYSVPTGFRPKTYVRKVLNRNKI